MGIEIREFEFSYEEGTKNLAISALSSVGIDVNKYPEILSELSSEYLEEQYRGRSRFWVALSEKEVIGSIGLLQLSDVRCEVKRMYVLSSFQREGVGQQLLDTALAFAKENKYSEVVLHTDIEMKGAQAFYKKNGFGLFEIDEDVLSYKREI